MVVAESDPRTCRVTLADRMLALATHACILGVVLPLLWIVTDLIVRGAASVSLDLLVEVPVHAGREGGIAPILVSTLLVMLVCAAVALPLGLAGAIGLAEFTPTTGWRARFVRVGLDVLAGTPSIVFGMFGYALFCVALGLGVSLVSGGLTLAVMVLPLFVRLAEQSIRTVPEDVRHALDALAMSRARAIVCVVLPVAMPGVVAAAGLALARALAETAAVLFTCGYALRMPGSLLDPGRTLSVHVFDLAMNVSGGDGMAYATALVLVAILLLFASFPMVASRRAGVTRLCA